MPYMLKCKAMLWTLLIGISKFWDTLFVPRLTKWGRGAIEFATVCPSVRPSVRSLCQQCPISCTMTQVLLPLRKNTIILSWQGTLELRVHWWTLHIIDIESCWGQNCPQDLFNVIIFLMQRPHIVKGNRHMDATSGSTIVYLAWLIKLLLNTDRKLSRLKEIELDRYSAYE